MKGLDAVVVLFTVLYFSAVYLTRKRWRLPPGPKGLPLIGNVFQLTKDPQWLQYGRWGKEYGPLFHLNFLSERVFVINSQRVASEIMDKNINTYADRPKNMFTASDLIGWNRAVALNTGGAQHRRMRRLMAKSLNSSAVRDYRPLQEQSAHALVRLFLDTPQDFLKHIRAVVGKSIVDISYGHDLEVRGDDYIDYAERVHEQFGTIAKPYNSLLDLFPILRHIPSWFPGFGFIPVWRDELEDLARVPFNVVKNDLETGDAPDSYVASCLRSIFGKPDANSRTEEEIMWSAVSFYTGGSDTTIVGLTMIILLMCLNPHVQKRAQEEIDRVVGNDRMPSFTDLPNLPYLSACIKETIRYWTIVPLGLPHRALEDGEYQGYDIPAGSTVVANLWAMMHDEEVYSDPFSYKPERFLPVSEGGLGEQDASPTVFGYGRRICPGMYLAEASLWMYAASVLAVFNITPVKDANGNPVPPVEETGADLISIPKPYVCDISPRSATSAALVNQ